MCDLLRNGDITTAQGILDAAGINIPTGQLLDGCYDEAGNFYRLPELVTSDPSNIKKDGGSRNSNNIDGDTMIGVPESTVEAKVLEGGDKIDKSNKQGLVSSIEEKGKATERDTVNVKCRLSDRGGPDVIIALGKTQHVSTLARRVQVEGKVRNSIWSPLFFRPVHVSPRCFRENSSPKSMSYAGISFAPGPARISWKDPE